MQQLLRLFAEALHELSHSNDAHAAESRGQGGRKRGGQLVKEVIS